jgi:hypothetical protein
MVVLALGLVAGCGSGGVCDSEPAPCGGDLVGTWAAVDTCFESSCQGFSMSKKPDNTSTLTFRNDMTVTASVSLTGTIAYKEPLSCLSGALTQKCSDLNQPPQNGNSLMCTGDTTCDCNGTLSITASSLAAIPYTTSGTNLTLGTNTFSYCVSGDHLFMRLPSSGMNSPIASSTLVLQRK